MRNLLQGILFVVLLASFCLGSCRKMTITTDPGAQLEFELDTLKFDTVFTGRGSATRFFKVYNRNSQAVNVSEIRLDGANGSVFRLNIDGFAQNNVNDIEIAGEDSLWIFCELTIDPDDQTNAFILKDSIVFETNGNTQQVQLEAFGQNANYIGESGKIHTLSCDESVWNDPKPYVILGFTIVDSCDLTIAPGTRVHFQGGRVEDQDLILPSGVLFVTPNASLLAEGTLDDPIVFRTDRIEPEFADVPGQWGGLWLFEGSTGNRIDHARIRNAVVGVRVDSAATLDISNTWIYENSGSGLAARHATIDGENLLIFDCSSFNVQMEFGGEYDFRHCSFVNYSVNPFVSHADPILRISNYWIQENTDGSRTLLENEGNLNITNTIIHGSRPEEIVLDNPDDVSANLNFNFDHCLIKADTLNVNSFINPIINEDPMFVDIFVQDYRLDTIVAPSVNNGTPDLFPPVPFDLDGNPRVDVPDIGCYEFQ
ncbi:MAG: hypothetical protein AAF598_00725 [Bacteroidota bacterium]